MVQFRTGQGLLYFLTVSSSFLYRTCVLLCNLNPILNQILHPTARQKLCPGHVRVPGGALGLWARLPSPQVKLTLLPSAAGAQRGGASTHATPGAAETQLGLEPTTLLPPRAGCHGNAVSRADPREADTAC